MLYINIYCFVSTFKFSVTVVTCNKDASYNDKDAKVRAEVSLKLPFVALLAPLASFESLLTPLCVKEKLK